MVDIRLAEMAELPDALTDEAIDCGCDSIQVA